jgi:diguanylate cyclase (GGDEF)-like protein
MLSVIFVIILEAVLNSTGNYDSPDINAITVTADALLLLFIIIMAGNKIEKQAEQLESLVLTDNLTSIYNLRGLNLHGEQKLLDARRNNTPLSVLVFDLDDLKVVNDQQGHEIGSKLIQTFANVLNNNFRSNDIVARVGGDEFVVITPEKLAEVNKTLKRFAQVIFEINKFTKQPYSISYSVGIAELQHNRTEDINDLINIADHRMYEAKKEKKDKLAAMAAQDYVI